MLQRDPGLEFLPVLVCAAPVLALCLIGAVAVCSETAEAASGGGIGLDGVASAGSVLALGPANAAPGKQSKAKGQPYPASRRTRTEMIESSRHTYRITLGGTLDAENTLAWREVFGRNTVEWPLFQPNLSVTIENIGRTDVKSAWLVVNGRDWYSIDTLLASVVKPDMSPREKAFAVYELFKKGFYHYNVAECRIDEQGYLVSDVLDPVKMFNCYENNGCSLHAINLATLWQGLGLKARVWNFATTHWVSEVFYDGGWHMLDADMRVFYLKRDNQTVAGVQDCIDDRSLITRTHHYGDFARTDVKNDAAHGPWYHDKNTGTPYRAGAGHRMDIHLRPGEKIVYRWDNIGKFHDNWRHKKSVPKFANGRFVYSPDFTKPYAARGATRQVNLSGFASRAGHLTPKQARQPAELVYRFASPYVIVGGIVEVAYRRTGEDEIGLDVSFDGKNWQRLWQADDTGAKRTVKVSLDAAIATRSSDAKYVYWLRVRFKAARSAANVGLLRMSVTTDFQASINALPSLRLGVNEIAYRDAGEGPHRVRVTHEWQESAALQPPAAPVPAGELQETGSLDPVLRWTQPGSPQKRAITHYRIQVRADPQMRIAVSPNLERLFAAKETHWRVPEGWLAANQSYYWRVRARDEAGIWSEWSKIAGPVKPRSLQDLRVGENLASRAKVSATRTVRSYKVQAAVDGDPKTLWAGGGGTDLRLHPADYFLDLGSEKIVDTVILTTDRLKNQLRLTAVAIYAWAGDDWDGKAVFETAGNRKSVIVCRFPAVKTSRLCIRCLDTARGDHSFAHLNEIEIYGAAEAPKRTLAPSGLPTTTWNIHDLAALDRQIARARRGSSVAKVRAEYLARRRPLLVESMKWKRKLDEETKRTAALSGQGAPQWAVALRDALKRYRLWAHWWISHQQQDGQFGGTYGDDVELTCGWPVLCLAQDDRKTFDALKRLADGVWRNIPSIRKFGYDAYSDVEHSAEPTSYSQPRMVVLDFHSRNPRYVDRCRRTFQTVLTQWMGTNKRGRLQFRSSWFGYDRKMKPRLNPKAMVDIPESAKALKPALYVVWATGDERVKQKLIEYGRTWAEAALTEYPGKPYGLLPARIRWDAGRPEGVHVRFASMRAMYFHLLACYRWTGDPVFLKPISEMLRKFVVEGGINDIPSASTYGKDTAKEYAICLSQLALTASLWRRLSGDRSLDPYFERWIRRMSKHMPEGHQAFYSLDRRRPELWLRDAPTVGAFRMPRYAIGTPLYLGWEVTGDKRFLVQACRNLSGDLTDQWGPLTYWFYDKTEPRVTSNDHLAHSIQWAAFALCLMTTGGPGPIEAPYPAMAVTWEGGGEDVVPLVVSHDGTHVRCILYNFRSAAELTATLWELAPGGYELRIGEDGDGDDRMDRVSEKRAIAVKGPTQARFSLGPGGPHVLAISKTSGPASD